MQRIKQDRVVLQQILLVDYKHCCFAKIYNDYGFEIVFEKDSRVQGKQRQGGQSAARFGRIREEVIKQWFKKVNDLLDSINGNLVVGCSSVYYKQFYNTLSPNNKDKIAERVDSEYSDASGVYQRINRLKGNTAKKF